jgi:hypothetical protein
MASAKGQRIEDEISADEELETATDPVERDEATLAFDALRQSVEKRDASLINEMTTIRRSVEAAFDQFEKFQQPADYSPDLGRITKHLTAVEQRLSGVEQSPVLKHGPEHYARTLERSGESLIQTAAQEFNRQADSLSRSGTYLANQIKGSRDRNAQNRSVRLAVAAGAIVGMLAVMGLSRFLPFNLDTRIASVVMGADRLNAGFDLIQISEPAKFEAIFRSTTLTNANDDAITKCRKDAKETRKDQECVIIVKGLDN